MVNGQMERKMVKENKIFPMETNMKDLLLMIYITERVKWYTEKIL